MPRIIDLFAGAGGISLGAVRAGFHLSGAVELDEFAVDTHSRNFPNSTHLKLDVAKLTGAELLSLVGLSNGELSGLVGGPPCQGFSAIGKRDIADPRNNLFHHFFRLVHEIQPAFFLAENVPGILDEKYDEIRTNAFSQLNNLDYTILPPIKVRASDYGAPTTRTRIFFFGYDQRRFRADFDVQDFAPTADIQPINVETALEGLPVHIDSEWQSAEAGWRPIEALPEGYYFERILNNVPSNIGHQESLERFFGDMEVSGCMGTRHTSDVIERFTRLGWGETDKISRAVRLSPSGFCPTLRAGTAADKGSFQAVRPIHHLSPRVITPREAARLQGFPDWFVFQPTKWHSFRQIGNSVSPLVSEFIFTKIRSKLI
ncbi:DNA cytosine methyltransferase [Massilia rhizosphaerae]|uniref:DNA cytosine methyltransferase n=1 Tax=Massilia rhizosphaerae TaxID=2784389 RepID=UPI0018DD32CF|nr:DNA cytosine methyltransferase [Massilia rhizosphaerae]